MPFHTKREVAKRATKASGLTKAGSARLKKKKTKSAKVRKKARGKKV